MTYGEKPEALVSQATAARLKDAIMDLRVQDGILMDSRAIVVHDVPGVEAVGVGEAQRGMYVVLSRDADAEGPHMRDVFLFQADAQSLHRVTIELDEEELRIIEKCKQTVQAWNDLRVTLDPLEQAEELERFQADNRGFSDSIEQYKGIVDLGLYGDVSEEEVQQRLAGVKLGYTVYETDDPVKQAYETKYIKCAKATLNYQSLIVDIEQRLEMACGDIVDNPESMLSGQLEVPFTEARAWNLLALLDRVESATR